MPSSLYNGRAANEFLSALLPLFKAHHRIRPAFSLEDPLACKDPTHAVPEVNRIERTGYVVINGYRSSNR